VSRPLDWLSRWTLGQVGVAGGWVCSWLSMGLGGEEELIETELTAVIGAAHGERSPATDPNPPRSATRTNYRG